jgi:hypothetical protein
MQVLDHVAVSLDALIGWRALPQDVREKLLETLTSLTRLPPEQWPPQRVHKLPLDEPVYFLRGPDAFRVFFRREKDGGVTVLDLVLQETLDRFFTNGHKPPPTA